MLGYVKKVLFPHSHLFSGVAAASSLAESLNTVLCRVATLGRPEGGRENPRPGAETPLETGEYDEEE